MTSGIPRIAMQEISPNRYWVVVNFPGRTSLTLSTIADRELAEELMECARRIAEEALAYAESQKPHNCCDHRAACPGRICPDCGARANCPECFGNHLPEECQAGGAA